MVVGYMWRALFSDGTRMNPYPEIFKSKFAACASRDNVTRLKSPSGAFRMSEEDKMDERLFESEYEIDRINNRMRREAM